MDWPVFVGVTFGLFGFAAAMTGRAVADAWQGPARLVGYVVLLGAGCRFAHFAFTGGGLWSPAAWLLDTLALLIIALVAHRLVRVSRMVRQYPWLYRRAGPFSWRRIGAK